MVGEKEGFIGRLREIKVTCLSDHCVIHQWRLVR